ncbi:MAG TPA: hypothetical protein VFS43_35465 [Polyangiaceae bacterium]|nr:hypothetical protein [Polyangiaceae bacterium]
MKTKTILSTRWALLLSPLTLLTVGGGLGACSGEFEVECPDGRKQTGGGDVDEACSPVAGAGGQGGAPAAGSGGGGPAAGAGGGAPAAGSGGGGGMVPIPPGADCAPSTTKCEGDAQQTCGADGTWGAPAACEIACDGAGTACVVPVQVSVGILHACALLSDGTVRCWGDDELGQLGQGVQSNSSKPVTVPGLTEVEAIDAGNLTTCALRKDKSLLCWGNNSHEQIAPNANGTLNAVRVPTEMGVQGVQDVDAGDHVCLLRTSGTSTTAQCRGFNAYGQLGSGSDANSASFVAVQGLPNAPVQLSRGGLHTCGVLQSGAVYCWGWNIPLGFADAATGVSSPRQYATSGYRSTFAGLSFSCAIGTDDAVSCWGANEYGQLGRGANVTLPRTSSPGKVEGGAGVKEASAGFHTACMLKGDGSVWCWGANRRNQLGNSCAQISCVGSGEGAFVRSPVQVSQLTQVEQIDGSGETFCALQADQSVVCWGNNDKGQLGNGLLGGSSATPTPVVWK